jgi:hypothetical protein
MRTAGRRNTYVIRAGTPASFSYSKTTTFALAAGYGGYPVQTSGLVESTSGADKNLDRTLALRGVAPVPEPKAQELKETDGKDKLVAALKASFDFCNTSMRKVTDATLGDTIEVWGYRKAPRAFALIALTNDWADHYSTAAMYLRLNGLLPPTAKK